MINRNIEDVISNLTSNYEPLDTFSFSDLSNLTRVEQKALQKEWYEVSLDRRRNLIRLMSEQAEEDIQLDFSSIYIIGLEDTDAQVRHLSIEALWECEDIKLIRIFLRLLQEDPSIEVRASAASGLGRFVFQGEMEYLTPARLRELVEVLIKIFSDYSLPLAIRRRAIEALAYSTDARVYPFISQAYESAENEMRASALFAMGRTADPYWSGTVRIELFNEELTLRFEAVRAAGEITDKQAVSRVAALLLDEKQDSQIREMAAWALGEIGGEVAKKVLRSMVKIEDSSLRAVIKESLAEIALFDDQNPSMGLSLDDILDSDDEVDEWLDSNDEYDDEYDELLDEYHEHDDESPDNDDWDSNQDWHIVPLS